MIYEDRRETSRRPCETCPYRRGRFVVIVAPQEWNADVAEGFRIHESDRSYDSLVMSVLLLSRSPQQTLETFLAESNNSTKVKRRSSIQTKCERAAPRVSFLPPQSCSATRP
jgi:hypothetical protein